MHHSSNNIEAKSFKIIESINPKKKWALGQFMTPPTIANFMTALFPKSTLSTCSLLDAGAGIGALSSSFIDRWISGGFSFKKLELNALEVDETLHAQLVSSLAHYGNDKNIEFNIHLSDFIQKTVNDYLPKKCSFTHAILNPPYKKISSHSEHRYLLRTVGIETVNLYSAFVALSLSLLVPGGYLVAIIPRSFCNGPYYRPFREFIFANASIKHIHLFTSRNKAFKDDGVLQENIIILLERGKQQNKVKISTSTDDNFSDYTLAEYPFSRIVNKNEAEKFIHIPSTKIKSVLELSSKVCYYLSDLDIQVSTGPIVDFRVREYLRDMPETDTVPLFYPGHFTGMSVIWPNSSIKKANAILEHPVIDKWLYPSGFYTVIKRFSSKEERRRIIASIVDPKSLPYTKLGFENHLNILHRHKKGLPELISRGIAIFLNSTAVDNHFRQFNGHTQVNATDLRQMKYPSLDVMHALGKWSKAQKTLDQVIIDNKVDSIL
jgi:adenine-specific DNA-methyltransferase